MDIKTGLLVVILLSGCVALPSLSPDDDHIDARVRIVGGSKAAVGSHPYMVALTTGARIRSLFCGGSLITQRTILTAAHCINFVYTGGSLTRNRGGTTYRIQRNITHPHNVASTIKNDLGILITSFKVALTNRVRTVSLTYSFIGNGVRSVVAGWGRTANAASSASLLELKMKTLGGNDCVDRVTRASVEFNSSSYVEPHIEICTLHSTGIGVCNCIVKLSNSLWALFNMDFKTGLLVFTLLAGCIALPTNLESPEDDMSIFFDHTNTGARIVGGNQAAPGSHPHMVALTTGNLIRSYFCGGSLITQRTILTAAHCIRHAFSGSSLSRSLRAIVGTNVWNNGGTAYTIARNVTHPHYVHHTIKNDIGILITSSNVALSNLVRTIPITYSYIPGGVRSRVAGWGRIRAGGALSANLLELYPTTIEGRDCESRIAQAAVQFNSPNAHVQSHIEICTFHATGFGTCNGDSGSALIRADDGQQFGIVSWGFPCALGVPDMFVRISAYENWLRANVV